jgi:tRNA threonylcarbamoyl adenosine modification protein YeaZ
MKTLALDTSTHLLVIALIDHDRVVAKTTLDIPKRQSEMTLPEVHRLMTQIGWSPSDLNAVVVTDGPGSYTGLRIAMTIAKVLAVIQPLELYTIGTLQLWAGDLPRVRVVLDARAKRVFTGVYDQGVVVEADHTIATEVLISQGDPNDRLVGYAQLLGRDALTVDLAENFVLLRPRWNRVTNIHALVPRYLKDPEHSA